MPDAGEFPAVSVQVVPTTQVLDPAVVLPLGVNVPVQVTASLATEITPREPLPQVMSALDQRMRVGEIYIWGEVAWSGPERNRSRPCVLQVGEG